MDSRALAEDWINGNRNKVMVSLRALSPMVAALQAIRIANIVRENNIRGYDSFIARLTIEASR